MDTTQNIEIDSLCTTNELISDLNLHFDTLLKSIKNSNLNCGKVRSTFKNHITGIEKKHAKKNEIILKLGEDYSIILYTSLNIKKQKIINDTIKIVSVKSVRIYHSNPIISDE